MIKITYNPESKKITDDQSTSEELYREYQQFLYTMEEDSGRRKRRVAKDIVDIGEKSLKEIEIKNKKREELRLSMIEYIYDKSKEKFITQDDLEDLPFEDVEIYYKKVVESKKSFIRKLFEVFS